MFSLTRAGEGWGGGRAVQTKTRAVDPRRLWVSVCLSERESATRRPHETRRQTRARGVRAKETPREEHAPLPTRTVSMRVLKTLVGRRRSSSVVWCCVSAAAAVARIPHRRITFRRRILLLHPTRGRPVERSHSLSRALSTRCSFSLRVTFRVLSCGHR